MKFIEQWQLRKRNKIVFGDGVNPWLAHRIKFEQGAKDNEIVFEKGFRCGKFLLDVRGQGNRVVIGENTRFGGRIVIRGEEESLEIGAGCHMVNAYLVAAGANLRIGEECLVSREVVIRNSDIHPIYEKGAEHTEENRQNSPQDLEIGRHVWIGSRAFLSKGAIQDCRSSWCRSVVCCCWWPSS